MKNITMIIEDESDFLNISEFADFLHLFRGTVNALTKIIPETEWQKIYVPSNTEVFEYINQIQKYSIKDLDSLFSSDKPAKVLSIMQIKRQSPTEIVMAGSVLLIVLAVIFSGGKIEISGVLKAHLPPFGTGVKALRSALGLDKSVKATFGVRDSRIKLSSSEYSELMKQDPSTRGDGGFQRFLVDLQHRIDHRTKTLELSMGDLERIYRYKANPGKGGWQSRFKKIFGRSFP